MAGNSVPWEISCVDVKAKLDNGDDFLFIDCREEDEHQKVSISAAKFFPMSDITSRGDDLAGNEDKPIVVHCHHGGRSMRVARWLRQQGFSKAQSMAGGIDTWAEEIETNLERY